MPILLKAGFAMKQTKVKVLAQEIQFAGIKWQDRQCVSMDMINTITAMISPTNKKETQTLGCCGFLENAYSGLQSDYKPSLSHDP